jgi:exodeoxyribonuclease V alpha subunit
MDTEVEKIPSETLTGTIRKIVFSNEENGFSILSVEIAGTNTTITVCGVNLAKLGDTVICEGIWKTHETYGLQFVAEQIVPLLPVTAVGIANYLIDNLRGVGEKLAERIVAKFGTNTMKILDEDIDRLAEVDGVKGKKLEGIKESWKEQSALREIMLFLQSHGVTGRMAYKIYRTYGSDAMRIIMDNPWQMARDVDGIGFRVADTIAMKLGKPKDCHERLRAGLSYMLYEMVGKGNCGMPKDRLIEKTVADLGVEKPLVERVYDMESQEKRPSFVTENGVAWSTYLYPMETRIAARLLKMKNEMPSWAGINPEEAIEWAQNATGHLLAEHQREALIQQIKSKVMVITGGPGCGKTFLLNSILHVLQRAGVNFSLCAPTGKAAMRMTEATGYAAATMHRAMKLTSMADAPKPLECELLVIDEASMVDIPLLAKAIEALPEYGALLFVGDADQLPSVGPGALLNDIIKSNAIPVVRLTKIFRQAEGSYIIRNAHRVNRGEMIEAGPRDGDFFYMQEEDPEAIPALIEDLVAKRLPERFGYDPMRDIQVLSPMNRAACGTIALNQSLQQRLNPEPIAYHKFIVTRYGVGDRVMQTINNYDKGVFNGDSGVIISMDTENAKASVKFQNGIVDYEYRDLDELALAYAITIHKSQGADFPVVIIPLLNGHYTMLQRNLLYTGITRARNLCILVGQSKALQMAVSNNKSTQRFTRLRFLLEQERARFTPESVGLNSISF